MAKWRTISNGEWRWKAYIVQRTMIGTYTLLKDGKRTDVYHKMAEAMAAAAADHEKSKEWTCRNIRMGIWSWGEYSTHITSEGEYLVYHKGTCLDCRHSLENVKKVARRHAKMMKKLKRKQKL